MAKIQPALVARLSAGLAIANMGQQVPDTIAEGAGTWSTSPANAVVHLWGNNMETNEHERMFTKDANWFANEIRQNGIEAILAKHGMSNPWIAKVIAASQNNTNKGD